MTSAGPLCARPGAVSFHGQRIADILICIRPPRSLEYPGLDSTFESAEMVWSMLRDIVVRDKHDPSLRLPGQTVLLEAARLRENKDMGEIVKKSSVDDLVWFLQVLELQLEETPHWVKDEQQLREIQAWHRRVRTMVSSILHNKRVKARPRIWLLKNVQSLFLIIFGAALALALRKMFG